MVMNLRTILMADGVVSGVAGLAMALGAQTLGPLTGLPEALLQTAGVALAPWTVALIWLARSRTIPRPGVMAVIAVNIGWVLASVAAVCVPTDGLWLRVRDCAGGCGRRVRRAADHRTAPGARCGVSERHSPRPGERGSAR